MSDFDKFIIPIYGKRCKKEDGKINNNNLDFIVKTIKEKARKEGAEEMKEKIAKAVEYQLGKTEDPYFKALHEGTISVIRALEL